VFNKISHLTLPAKSHVLLPLMLPQVDGKMCVSRTFALFRIFFWTLAMEGIK
jgi:hypothetical protein